MSFCEKCGEYILSATNKCNCRLFRIIDEDGEEHEFFAFDEKCAALKYAEKLNTDEDGYLMNSSIDVLVNGKAFRVGAEPDVYYYAKELEEER